MIHRATALRYRARRARRGFTLIELMVVVVLIALLALIAAPSMSVARADRIAFDHARQVSELFHNGHARAAGRGAAHLVVFTKDASTGGTRGAVFVFEGLDGTPAPTGPNPSSSCKAGAQWTWAANYVPGAAADGTGRARFVDGMNINTTEASAVDSIEDITMRGFSNTAGVLAEVGAIAVCTTPNGTTFVGTGTTVATAITEMVGTMPFTGVVEVQIARHRTGGKAGLNRRVILAGGAAPRIKAE